MRYWVRMLLGFALLTASYAAAAWAIYHLSRTSTCASGGPYVSRNPCPKGTGSWIVSLMGGIFGTLGGAALLASRGTGPLRRGIGIAIPVWSTGFLILAGAVLYSAYGPANPHPHHSKVGSMITAGIFVLLALGPLIGSLFGSKSAEPPASGRITPAPAPPPRPDQIQLKPRPGGPVPLAQTGIREAPRPPGGTAGEDDTLARLEKLGQLHANGTLDDAEFEAQKKKILGDV